MGYSSRYDDQLDQRLRRIEAQLHDILLLLDRASADTREQVALREVFRELEAEVQEQEFSFSTLSAANDESWP